MGLACESRPRLLSCWSAYTRPTAPATLRFSLTMRTSNLNDPIGRSYGVGRSEVFGAGRMRCGSG